MKMNKSIAKNSGCAIAGLITIGVMPAVTVFSQVYRTTDFKLFRRPL